MDYRPIKNAMSYLTNVYYGIKDITQKIGNSLFHSSGLELALAGVPDYVLNSPPKREDKTQGYYFSRNYTVKNIHTNGSKVTATRNDGRTISFDPNKAGKTPHSYVKGVLQNNGVRPDNGIIKKIIQLLNVNKKH